MQKVLCGEHSFEELDSVLQNILFAYISVLLAHDMGAR